MLSPGGVLLVLVDLLHGHGRPLVANDKIACAQIFDGNGSGGGVDEGTLDEAAEAQLDQPHARGLSQQVAATEEEAGKGQDPEEEPDGEMARSGN